MRNKNINNSDYGIIAQEYYEKGLHPTCHNFRELSKVAFSKIFCSICNFEKTKMLELGAGKSIFKDFKYIIPKLDNLIISDISRDMIYHSNKLRIEYNNVDLVLTNARVTCFKNKSFDYIIAILCDPYISTKLFYEVNRILKEDGRFFLSIPSYEWAKTYRNFEGSPVDKALFKTKNNYKYFKSKVIPLNKIIDFAKKNNMIDMRKLRLNSEKLNNNISDKIKLTNKIYSKDNNEKPYIIDSIVFKKR